MIPEGGNGDWAALNEEKTDKNMKKNKKKCSSRTLSYRLTQITNIIMIDSLKGKTYNTLYSDIFEWL